jgi:hypothetical protein
MFRCNILPPYGEKKLEGIDSMSILNFAVHLPHSMVALHKMKKMLVNAEVMCFIFLWQV